MILRAKRAENFAIFLTFAPQSETWIDAPASDTLPHPAYSSRDVLRALMHPPHPHGTCVPPPHGLIRIDAHGRNTDNKRILCIPIIIFFQKIKVKSISPSFGSHIEF